VSGRAGLPAVSARAGRVQFSSERSPAVWAGGRLSEQGV